MGPRKFCYYHVWDEIDPAATQYFATTVREARQVAKSMIEPSSCYVVTVTVTKQGIANALMNLPVN